MERSSGRTWQIRYCTDSYSRQQAIAAISARLIADDRSDSHAARGHGKAVLNGNSAGDYGGLFHQSGYLGHLFRPPAKTSTHGSVRSRQSAIRSEHPTEDRTA